MLPDRGMRLPLAAVLLATAGWLIFGAFAPPLPGYTDIFLFKDAGANLALGNGFTSRLTYGNPTFDRVGYAFYPPGYPFLFGVYSKLVGVGVAQNAAFNTGIAALAHIFGWAALAMGAASMLKRGLLVLVCLTLPLGFSACAYDRPDTLGLALGLGALLLLCQSAAPLRLFFSAILCGVAVVVSPPAGALSALAIVLLWASDRLPPGRDRRWPPFPLIGAPAVAGFLIAPSLAVYLLMQLDPTAITRFLGVLPEPGRFFMALVDGDWRTWSGGLRTQIAAEPARLGIASLAFVLGSGMVFFTLAAMRSRNWSLLIPCGGLVLFVAVPLTISPSQPSYVPIATGLLLALFSIASSRLEGAYATGRSVALVVAFVGMTILNAPTFARILVMNANLGPSLARMRIVISDLQHSEEGERLVAVAPQGYMLFKEAGFDVVNFWPGLDDAENRARIPLFALSFIGSGDALRPQYPPWWNEADYELVYWPHLPQRATVFGREVGNSSITWEHAVYRRRDTSRTAANPR
ncbi:MAG: hypothetical protein EPO20_09525 [Betaproteobacteria bacterium]|nr:MAG: hypothetical protein EPO20_09525 [Betaproteobacteria bacterium]